MSNAVQSVRKMLKALATLESAFLCFVLTFMIVMAFSQIVLRNFFSVGLFWADPMLRHLVLWVGLLGAAIATKDRNHITIDILSNYLTGRPKALAEVLKNAFTGTVCGLLTYASVDFFREEYVHGKVIFGNVPVWVAETVLPFAFGLMALRFTIYTVEAVVDLVRGNAGTQGAGRAAT